MLVTSVFTPCPKCEDFKCNGIVYRYESIEESNRLLNKKWACEFTEEQKIALEQAYQIGLGNQAKRWNSIVTDAVANELTNKLKGK